MGINSDDNSKKNTSVEKILAVISKLKSFEFASVHMALNNDKFLAPFFSTQTISQDTSIWK